MKFFALWTSEKNGVRQENSICMEADSMAVENGFLWVYNGGKLMGIYDLGVLAVAQLREEAK